MKWLGGCTAKAIQFFGEYSALLVEKNAKHEKYKAARKEMIDYQTAKNNINKILGLIPPELKKEKSKKMRH